MGKLTKKTRCYSSCYWFLHCSFKCFWLSFTFDFTIFFWSLAKMSLSWLRTKLWQGSSKVNLLFLLQGGYLDYQSNYWNILKRNALRLLEFQFMYRSNWRFNIPPPGNPGAFELLEFAFPPPGQKGVQMHHRRSILGDQMPPPPGDLWWKTIIFNRCSFQMHLNSSSKKTE